MPANSARGDSMINRSRLLQRVLFAFTLLVLVPIAASALLQAAIVSGRFREQVVDNTIMVANRYAAELDGNLRAVASIMTQLAANPDLRQVISDSQRQQLSGDTYMALQKMTDTVAVLSGSSGVRLHLLKLANTQHVFHRVYADRMTTQVDDTREAPWLSAALDTGSFLTWHGITREGVVPVMAVSCAVRDLRTMGIIGAISGAFYTADVFPMFADAQGNALLYLHAPTGALHDPSGALDGTALPDALRTAPRPASEFLRLHGEEHLLVSSGPGFGGWRVLYITPVGQAFSALTRATVIQISLLLVCFVLMSLFLRHVYARLVRPLDDAISFINQNTLHSVSREYDAGGYPELRVMQQRMASLVAGRHAAEEQLKHANEQADLSRLKTLQMQINPHFLYNTLNSVRALASLGRSQEVSDLMVSLIHILNACMDREGTFVTVRKEVDTLKRYFHIMEKIYGPSMRFEVLTDPDLDVCLVPNFILQPLAENALAHGLDQSRDGNRMTVTNRVSGDALEFAVTDNGVGIPNDKLREITQAMESGDAAKGIGLASVHQRIRISCGPEYGIRITSAVGEGTSIIVRLPLAWPDE